MKYHRDEWEVAEDGSREFVAWLQEQAKIAHDQGNEMALRLLACLDDAHSEIVVWAFEPSQEANILFETRLKSSLDSVIEVFDQDIERIKAKVGVK